MAGKFLKSGPLDAVETALMVDAMYYRIAVKALAAARRDVDKLEEARNELDLSHSQLRECVAEENEKGIAEAVEAVTAASHLLGISYAPFLESLATVHILSAASLE